MAKHRVIRGAAKVSLILLSWFIATGCATPGPDLEHETRLKQAKSHFNLGVDYLRTERVALGLRELLIAENYDPKDARIQYAIADAYLMRGKYEEAESHYRRVLELSPTFHEARLNLAALYSQLSRYEECLVESRLLAEDATFPAPWRALANQGWAELRLGRIEAARRSLELAREYNSTYWPTLLNLGILEMEQGNRLEAIALFQEVLEQQPNSEARAEANYRIGEIYVALGKRERAVAHLKAAVADTPGARWGVKSEEYLKLLR